MHVKYLTNKSNETTEGDDEQFAKFMADELKKELDENVEVLNEHATEDTQQPSSSQEEIPSTSKVQDLTSRGRHSSEMIQKNTTKHRSRSQSAPNSPRNAILDSLTADQLKIELKEFNLRDISNPLCDIVQKAVSLYRGDCSRRPSSSVFLMKLVEIKTVEIVVNSEVSRIYELKKMEYQNSGAKFEEVFAYHGTQPQNVESIKKTNLDPALTVRAAYGHGCYFSEHPEISHGYTQNCMFIFKLILVEGKYKKVVAGSDDYCNMLILTDKSHFKPEYVLYF